MSAAETRSCKGCANFEWAGTSPTAKARHDAYVKAKAEYDRWQEAENSKGFWADLLSLGQPPWMRPWPPFPELDPEHYGWCRLNPRPVEKSVNSWCSHHVSSSKAAMRVGE